MELRDIWNLRFGATWETNKVRMLPQSSRPTVEYDAISTKQYGWRSNQEQYIVPKERDARVNFLSLTTPQKLLEYVRDDDDINWLGIRSHNLEKMFIYIAQPHNLAHEDLDEMFRHSVKDSSLYPLVFRDDPDRPDKVTLRLNHADGDICKCLTGDNSPCSNLAMLSLKNRFKVGATWEPYKVRMIPSESKEYSAHQKSGSYGVYYLFPKDRDMEADMEALKHVEFNAGIGRLIRYVADNDDIDWLGIRNTDHQRVFVYLKPTPNLSQEDFDEMFRHSVESSSTYPYPLRFKNDEESPNLHKLDISHADDCQCIEGNTSPCSTKAMLLFKDFDKQVNKLAATWEPNKVKIPIEFTELKYVLKPADRSSNGFPCKCWNDEKPCRNWHSFMVMPNVDGFIETMGEDGHLYNLDGLFFARGINSRYPGNNHDESPQAPRQRVLSWMNSNDIPWIADLYNNTTFVLDGRKPMSKENFTSMIETIRGLKKSDEYKTNNENYQHQEEYVFNHRCQPKGMMYISNNLKDGTDQRISCPEHSKIDTSCDECMFSAYDHYCDIKAPGPCCKRIAATWEPNRVKIAPLDSFDWTTQPVIFTNGESERHEYEFITPAGVEMPKHIGVWEKTIWKAMEQHPSVPWIGLRYDARQLYVWPKPIVKDKPEVISHLWHDPNSALYELNKNEIDDIYRIAMGHDDLPYADGVKRQAAIEFLQRSSSNQSIWRELGHDASCRCKEGSSEACSAYGYQNYLNAFRKQAATWEPHRVKMPLVTVSELETCLGDKALQSMLAKTHEPAMTKWKAKIGARNEQEVQDYINNKVPYTVTKCLLDDDSLLATYEANSQANLHLGLERHNAIKIRGESIHPHIQITFLGHPGVSINIQARKMFSNLKDESIENPLDAFDESDIAGGLVVAYTDTDGHVHTHHAVRDGIKPTQLTDYASNFLHHFNNAWNSRHHDEWCSQGADCAI